MSHIVEIKTEVRDEVAVNTACQRLQWEEPQEGKFAVFTKEVTGLGVKLPGWRFPVVCDLKSGSLQYDNYKGRWGEQQELDRFLQCYAIELTKLEARKQGHTVVEQPLEDGSVKLTIEVGGVA